jgi:hypothetical protein
MNIDEDLCELDGEKVYLKDFIKEKISKRNLIMLASANQ